MTRKMIAAGQFHFDPRSITHGTLPQRSGRTLGCRGIAAAATCWACALASILAVVSDVQATVVGLELLQSTTATNSWDFESPNRFDDKTGNGLNLTDTQTNPLAFPQGLDETSDAIKFPNAEGYAQSSSFTQPTDATVEFLILPGDSTDGEQHFLSQIQANSNRNYMFQSGQSSIRWNRGNPSTIRDVIGGTSSVAFDASHWYYAALASTYDDGSDTFTLNAYARDLTAEGPLVQVLTNAVNAAGDGGLGSTFLRFGKNAASGNNDFNGTLDAVAYYDSILSLADAQSHSNVALAFVPEPSTFLLLGMGMLVLLRRRRRQTA